MTELQKVLTVLTVAESTENVLEMLKVKKTQGRQMNLQYELGRGGE